jgi:hypothetical protein
MDDARDTAGRQPLHAASMESTTGRINKENLIARIRLID